MKNVIKTILIIAVILILSAIILLVSLFLGRVPSNPADTIGNTAGNLNNGGYFCEDNDGTVFFANFYDHGTLYSMNADESNIRKLSDFKVSNLNTGGRYLYYYMPDSMASAGLGFVRKVVGVYRCSKKASAVTTLSRNPAGTMVLSGNQLLLQNAPGGKSWNLSSLDINGKNTEILMTNCINPVSCHNGIIYFADTTENHFLCSYDTATGTKQQLLKYNVWDPVYESGSIFFMDIENDYRLCSYSLATGQVELITSDRIDFYNVTPNYIYYQKSSETEPALKRIRLDGTEEEIVASGTYHHINATSQYVYFQEYNDPVTIYHTPLNGPVSVTEFNAALEAAYKK